MIWFWQHEGQCETSDRHQGSKPHSSGQFEGRAAEQQREEKCSYECPHLAHRCRNPVGGGPRCNRKDFGGNHKRRHIGTKLSEKVTHPVDQEEGPGNLCQYRKEEEYPIRCCHHSESQ